MLRLFGYYAVHSVWNGIRKLFKTWVAIFFAVCIIFGIIIGGVAATLSNLSDNQQIEENVGTVDVEDEIEEVTEGISPERVMALVELFSGLVVLAFILYEAMSGDKQGSAIFTMADVNFLFPSPMRPQTVLMFKLLTQLGMAVLAGIYMIFQLPNLVMNAGVPLSTAIMLLVCWTLLLFFAKLIQVLVYTVCSTHEKLKKYIRPVGYAVILAIAGGFMMFYKTSGLTPMDAAIEFFNKPFTRYIPIYGWIKALPVYTAEGNVLAIVLSCVALVLLAILMIWGIWQFKADFYEEALQKSTERQEKIEANQATVEGGKAVVQQRKKERSDKIDREGFAKGSGANVFFYKTVFNRFRFAHLHFFTKTMEFYLVLSVAVSLLLKFVFHFENLYVVALGIAICTFYRAMQDPISVDIENPIFHMVPATPWAKVFWSLLGGLTDNFLDILIPMLLATIMLKGNPVEALLWTLVICTVNLYAGCANLFLSLSLPTTLPAQIKTMILVMFVYFGMMPPAIILIVGLILNKIILFAIITVAANLVLAALGYTFACLLAMRGRR